MTLDGGYDSDGNSGNGKLPFAVRHPVVRGLFTMFLGFVAVAVIDIIFYAIGGMKMMERFGIIPVAIGVLFFLKGYVQMLYPPRC